MPRIRKVLLLGAVCLLAAPAAAVAGPPKPPAPELATVALNEPCPVPELSQPLGGFGDQRSYVLAPGGAFELGAEPWVLFGGARVTEGNEPWYVAGEDDSHALFLPRGATAVSPPFCVDANWPTFRLFAQGEDKGRLKVEILPAHLPLGRAELAGEVSATKGRWGLSDDLHLHADDSPRHVVVRLTAPKGGDWSVDNVLVDPRMR